MDVQEFPILILVGFEDYALDIGYTDFDVKVSILASEICLEPLR